MSSTTVDPARKLPFKRWLLDLVVYGVPAYFLSSYLQRLGGTALLIPPPWRKTVTLLVLGGGLACFELARNHRQRLEKASRPASDPAGSGQVLLLAMGPEAVQVEVGPLREEPERPADSGYGQRLSLACVAGALLLLVPHIYLRFHCVIPWLPDNAVINHLYGDPEDRNSPPDMEEVAASVAPPVLLDETESGYSWSVNVPLRSRLSADLQKRIADRSEYFGEPGVQAFLNHEPIEFIEALQAEVRAMSETVVLFLVVHVAILLLASAGYGYSYGVIEEFVQFFVPDK
jgi:hypothetical protein